MVLKGKNMKKLLFLSVPLMLMGTIAFTANRGVDAKQADFDAEKLTLREENVRPNDYIAREPVGMDVITMSGNGTESNPYIIKTAAHFAQMRYDLNACYKLNNDINFNNAVIDPIPGTFQGKLYGNGKTLSKFKISRNYQTSTNSENLGLFQTIGNYGDIYNLTIKDSLVEAKEAANSYTLVYAGLICGMNYGTIENITCYRSRVNIENKIALAGGISGYSNAQIITCLLYGCKVFGSDVVGGITASADNNSLTECCIVNEDRGFWPWEVTESQVKLVVKNANSSLCAGGIAGYCYGSAVIDSCYVKNTKFIVNGTLSNSPLMGYIAGHMNRGTIYYTQSFFTGNSKTNINSAYTTYYFANYNGHVGKAEGYPRVVERGYTVI